MPAKDRLHDNVVHALEKADWKIVREQFGIALESRTIWIDLRAQKEQENLVILVEVKDFDRTGSPVHYLANALGQYLLYRSALILTDDPTPLYMALPISSYNRIMTEDIGQDVIQRYDLRLIVFNPLTEEIVQWIP